MWEVLGSRFFPTKPIYTTIYITLRSHYNTILTKFSGQNSNFEYKAITMCSAL
jgi:hypothetical protein